jgi:hypothetical protein
MKKPYNKLENYFNPYNFRLSFLCNNKSMKEEQSEDVADKDSIDRMKENYSKKVIKFQK